ncbi:hypothetical protein R6Q57_012929 [Mikania cordata]
MVAFTHPHPHRLCRSLIFASCLQKLPFVQKYAMIDLVVLNCREKFEAYSMEMKRLAVAILGQMALALGMDTQEMTELFQDGVQSVRMNYYPPCPQPEMALDFSSHYDADALTILYQLNQTTGLQIRKDGNWVTVKPRPDALVVNVGDILEITSNGVYKSIEHQASSDSEFRR